MRGQTIPLMCACGVLFVAAAVPAFGQAKAPLRSAKELQLDLGDVYREIDSLGSNPTVILTICAAKPEHAAKVIAALKKRRTLTLEYARVTNAPAGSNTFDILWGDALLYALHDDETVKALDAGVKAQHADAKLAQAVGNWYLNATKAEEQSKILDSLRPLAKSFPADDTLARVLIHLAGTLPAKPEIAAAVDEVIFKLRSPSALHYKNMPRAGKPFALVGTQLDGQAFSSAKLKGKIVLVHFWSPEHTPSRAEAAALKKLLDDNKGKGLEVVGVVSMCTAAEASRFLSENKYTWPELFDSHMTPTQYHPLVLACNVIENNEVLVLDRAGNYRVTLGREQLADLDTLVPKLLVEKPAAATGPATATAPATQLFH